MSIDVYVQYVEARIPRKAFEAVEQEYGVRVPRARRDFVRYEPGYRIGPIRFENTDVAHRFLDAAQPHVLRHSHRFIGWTEAPRRTLKERLALYAAALPFLPF